MTSTMASDLPEPFDYTKFRHELCEGMTLEDVCREAAEAKLEADSRNS
jgi:hypothetical protein